MIGFEDVSPSAAYSGKHHVIPGRSNRTIPWPGDKKSCHSFPSLSIAVETDGSMDAHPHG